MKVLIERTHRLLNDFFRVDEVVLRYEKFDGSMSGPVRRLVLDRGDAVAALVLNTATGRLVLANQLRFPTYAKGPGWLIEIVAGLVDAGEEPETAIRREIREESGREVTKLEPISTFYVTPGGSNERVFLFYAEAGAPMQEHRGGGDDEDIALIELEPDEAFRRIEAGEIVDAKTIVALYWLRNRLGR
jgi:nudix-type nucleoside diphosphatase (YffH/AdpP family)